MKGESCVLGMTVEGLIVRSEEKVGRCFWKDSGKWMGLDSEVRCLLLYFFLVWLVVCFGGSCLLCLLSCGIVLLYFMHSHAEKA